MMQQAVIRRIRLRRHLHVVKPVMHRNAAVMRSIPTATVTVSLAPAMIILGAMQQHKALVLLRVLVPAARPSRHP